eukprot:272509_1
MAMSEVNTEPKSVKHPSHLESKDELSQNTQKYPSYANTTSLYPNTLQSQQAFAHSAFAHSAFAYPTIQQQIPIQTQATPTQQQPQLLINNSQHIYDPKKSGIVNEIINTINSQQQKLLQSVLLTQETISNFNYYNDYIIKKCDMLNELEERYKRHYCNLEKKLNKEFKSLNDIKK